MLIVKIHSTGGCHQVAAFDDIRLAEAIERAQQITERYSTGAVTS